MPTPTIADTQAEVAAARAAGDEIAAANALIYLSSCFEVAGLHEEAVQAALEGVALHREVSTTQLPWALENLGRRYSAAGQSEQAASVTLIQATLADGIGDQEGSAYALILLSAFLESAAQGDESILAAREGVGIYRELKSAQLPWALENLARRYFSAGRLQDSVTTTEEWVTVTHASGNAEAIASALSALAFYQRIVQDHH